MKKKAKDRVRTAFRNKSVGELVTEPIDALLGVSPPAAKLLEQFGISTIFDLASSRLFDTAHNLTRAADGSTHGLGRYRLVPGDAVDDSATDESAAQIIMEPVDVLRDIGEVSRKKIEQELRINTVRDLGLWPPFHEARAILAEAYGASPDTLEEDPEAPSDLVPGTGLYPTERVQYEVLVFEKVTGGTNGTIPLNLKDAGQLDIGALMASATGFSSPAVGALLTFNQSWYTQGLALGNLIHSVALGPGESTKIAMIDWSRRTRTSTTEAIDEGEALQADLSRTRAITEITSAVANETQTGQSAAQSFAHATERGSTSGGVSATGLGIFDLGKAPGLKTEGTSSGESSNFGIASSWATSSGHRDVTAEMSQNISDRTQQAAHSTRSRRASIVREVSQEESERLTTRAVTNYNHMHALTVQYYEVVQLFRTVIEMARVERVLFVPMKLLDFRDSRVVDRFRLTIARVGLLPSVRALVFANTGRTAISSPSRLGDWDALSLERTEKTLREEVGDARDAVLSFPQTIRLSQVTFQKDAPFGAIIATMRTGDVIRMPLAVGTGDDPIFLDKLYIESGDLRSKFPDLVRLEAEKKNQNRDFAGTVAVVLFDVVAPPYDWLYFNVEVLKDSQRVVLLEVQQTIDARELSDHLMQNQLYYSQAIWRSIDPATLGMLLSNHTYAVGNQQVRLIELVDPTPVGIIGNYLGFRAPGLDDSDALNNRYRKPPREDFVPVPSGGVFAEAVLGRFNSAEKLDITRFWNWQDSPIPIQAPDIAAIQAGSRRDPDLTTPGQLSAPVLNIVNPPSLPDPQGMGAVLAAIQNGNMFRDMSGLAATIGLAQAGIASAQQGASHASEQATQNAAIAAQLGAKVAELAAKLIAAYVSKGASLATGAGGDSLAGLAGGISGQGAKINKGRDMDERGVPSQTSNKTGNGSSAGSGGWDGRGPAPGGSTGDGIGVGSEGAAFSAALGGGPGGIPAQLLNAILGAAPLGLKALSAPPIRWCCALQMNDGIEPADVKDHMYGSTSLANVGYVYTEKAGIVDIGHVRDHADLTKFVYDAILAGHPTIPCREGTATLTTSPRDPIATAQAIAFVDSWSHELGSFNTLQDFSAFSPEDLPSNFLGTYVGARALAMGGSGGSFNPAIDTLLAGLLASLGARSKADTDVVIASLKNKWYETFPPKLLRRNFDATPFVTGSAFDKPPAPAFIDASTLTPLFADFDYESHPLKDGSIVKLADFPAQTDRIRAPFKAAKTDRP